jgi:hypothetical protein
MFFIVIAMDYLMQFHCFGYHPCLGGLHAKMVLEVFGESLPGFLPRLTTDASLDTVYLVGALLRPSKPMIFAKWRLGLPFGGRRTLTVLASFPSWRRILQDFRNMMLASCCY